MAQATSGMLRNTEARPRAMTLKKVLMRVVRDPIIASITAKTAATVVDATDIKTVSQSFCAMSGSFVREWASG